MFEPLPEKPPHMASHWIMFTAIAGGIAGLAGGMWTSARSDSKHRMWSCSVASLSTDFWGYWRDGRS